MKRTYAATALSLALSSLAFASGSGKPNPAPGFKDPVVAPDVASGEGTAHRLVFQNPLLLNGKVIPVKVTREATRFDPSDNSFEKEKDDAESRYCNIRLAIQGRDIAVNNSKLGEHYFGKMEMACGSGSYGRPAFNTIFSRVFVLGIRNCIESETMVDQDYCDLYVVAMRRKTEINEKNGDLIKDTGNYQEKYVVHSAAAQKNVTDGAFLPAGLNPEHFDGFQTFKLSIGKGAGEYFIPSPTASTSIGAGKAYYLTVAQDSERQTKVEGTVRENLTKLETIVSEVRAAPTPAEAFNTRSNEYFRLYAATAKTLLEVVHPVTFYRLEANLKALETQVIDMLKVHDPSITNRDSLLSKYQSALAGYDRIKGYYTENATADKVDYAVLVGAKGVMVRGKKNLPLIGDVFDSDGMRYEEYAKNNAISKCWNKVKSTVDEVNDDPSVPLTSDYKCVAFRAFIKGDYWYAQARVEAANK